jgi:alkaline phosphatase
MRCDRILKATLITILAVSTSFFADAQTSDVKTVERATVQNIIVMISDGCGFHHVDAASYYQYGQTGKQVYEKFPVHLAMSTFEEGQQYDPKRVWGYFKTVMLEATDSAAAATALSCGEKTYGGSIGMDIDENPLVHAFTLAEQRGKATGVVTSVQFAHATPAAFVAHNVSRNNYEEIATQMILESPVDVIIGCGHPEFDDNGQPVEHLQEENYRYVGGRSTWEHVKEGRPGADANGDGTPDKWTLVETRDDFLRLTETPDAPMRLLGIPQVARTLQQKRQGNDQASPYLCTLIQDIPTLKTLTQAALNVLDNDSDGFCLMVEGGAVDWASHANQPGRMIEEQIDFNRSVEAVVEWVEENSSWNETLLIVTADHECGYLTGPDSGPGNPPVWNPIENHGVDSLPGMQWNSGSHTNSLVPLYAKGYGVELFEDHIEGIDPVHGEFVDNTSLGRVMRALLY